ncbi:UDP-N-acetylmuramoyl-tripeptide--D-alanyl-D-alanine ligase [Solibacillus sp. CAU 1738]|uniref:UDP-N-acetylmuramoyl-tripeptide--D-alanyl-D- alanine ligase n=1 Tax=Solibacillus sp. CAU 1738 TaxID=3140363 RepID=UPI003261AED6
MKPTTVSRVTGIIGGELVKGDGNIVINYGAYRLKQVKNKHTILFNNTRILNWQNLEAYFPLIIVSEWGYRISELPSDVVLVKVANLDDAYWRFVEHYRGQFEMPIVAITGTSGKTSTKEMIKHILSTDKQVVATTLSNNSRTGSLYNLLRIDDATDVGVFETAVGSPGDVLTAGRYFKPTIGVITNIGSHHLNYCKTQEGYIKAKAEMLQILDKGTLIINDDDQNIQKIDMNYFPGKVIRYGKQNCQYQISDIKYGERGMHFTLHHATNQYSVIVPGFGEHQVYNAVAALVTVHEIGIPMQDAIAKLATYRQFNKQMQVMKGIHNSVLIDDTWSITTTSLEAALKVLNELGKNKKRIAIIGTITDLGSWGYIIHERAGELIYKHGVDVLITIGKHAKIMADKARELGLQAKIYSYKNNTLPFFLLQKMVDSNTVILIKGDMYSETVHDLADKLIMRPPSK